MEFNPSSKAVVLCLQAMNAEDKDLHEEAGKLFQQAWDEAENDLEKFIAAHFVALHQKDIPDTLKWLETALELALKINDDTVKSAFPTLYLNIAKCYESLNQPEKGEKYYERSTLYHAEPSDSGPFFHGTKANLQIGELLTPGGSSNYKADLKMNHIYFTAAVNGAGLAASLAKGDGTERVYIVEPTGIFENDPNVTNQKFPGNPTRSYRSASPLKIIGEAVDWKQITPEDLRQWREKLANNKGNIIN
jgi:tetratricopeptide (TPR) repeat protein